MVEVTIEFTDGDTFTGTYSSVQEAVGWAISLTAEKAFESVTVQVIA